MMMRAEPEAINYSCAFNGFDTSSKTLEVIFTHSTCKWLGRYFWGRKIQGSYRIYWFKQDDDLKVDCKISGLSFWDILLL